MNNQSEIIEEHFGKVAALIGEKSRAIMLWNLLDGRSYTATELAICANISKQACSNHLSKLVEGNLLVIENQGRHRYYRFANDRVAYVVENIAYLLPDASISLKSNPKELEGIRRARTCYDHIAGKLGVEITKVMLQKEVIKVDGSNYVVTDHGSSWLKSLEIDICELQKMKRRFAYPCLDWSERKSHIGGSLGAALLSIMLRQDWFRKMEYSRELLVTAKGKAELLRKFDLET